MRTEDFDQDHDLASHNPYYDNGIKVMNESGEKMEESVITEIENLDGEIGRSLAKRDQIGRTQDFAKRKKPLYWISDSIATRSFKGMKVALDCANGSASVAKSVV